MSKDDIKRVEILEGKVHYSYVSIVSIVPSKFQHQAVRIMLERVNNKKILQKSKRNIRKQYRKYEP